MTDEEYIAILRADMEIYTDAFLDIMVTSGKTRAGKVLNALYNMHEADKKKLQSAYNAALCSFDRITPTEIENNRKRLEAVKKGGNA